MKIILLIFTFISCLNLNKSFAKGCSGIYFINGTAYSIHKTVLKNATLTIKFGEEIETISTDGVGHYEIALNWDNACPSSRTRIQHKRDNKALNPQFIYINFLNKKIKLRNRWQKFSGSFFESKDLITWHKNLYFR
jgi:hypothetical protein